MTAPSSAPIPWLSLDDLKNDLNLEQNPTTRDDAALQLSLSAAMAWVQRHRPDVAFTGPWSVPADVRLGTLRLAERWFVRRNTPDGLMNLGELGSGTVPKVDPDIITMLGILPTFA